LHKPYLNQRLIKRLPNNFFFAAWRLCGIKGFAFGSFIQH
jgi:hypothetical protein